MLQKNEYQQTAEKNPHLKAIANCEPWKIYKNLL
jgi:hypothetical protein